MRRSCRVRPVLPPRSAFAGFRFPREVIVLAVRWYLRYGLSYRDVEELLAERCVAVDHVTIYRRVQTFTPGVHRRRPTGPARERRQVVRRRRSTSRSLDGGATCSARSISTDRA